MAGERPMSQSRISQPCEQAPTQDASLFGRMAERVGAYIIPWTEFCIFDG
ncbi:MAG: hypothetical protein IJN16_11180 [Lachnospiraceae bacterium]|nr:hypothetical protein [Lachnospiraceae bacterium]